MTDLEGKTARIKSGTVQRLDRCDKIISLIESGRGQGMQLMDDSIMQRYKDGMVSAEDAYLWASDKSRFAHMQKRPA